MSTFSHLKWHCRRGMRELDVVLGSYLEKSYQDADPSEQKAFERLLQLEDPRLYALLMGYETTDNSDERAVLAKLGTLFSDPQSRL